VTTSLAPGARAPRLLLVALALLGALRLATLGLVPLVDRSESRYAEMGRVMVATGNWRTPQLAPGDPYWGKPPLHLWATAASLTAFGTSEFAARLPSWLGALVVLATTWRMARRGAEAAALACLVLASSVLFYTLAAQVSLDITLAVCTTAALAGWSLARREPEHAGRWHALAFFALGAGLLAKGPVALALFVVTLALACAGTRDLRWLRGVPWTLGVALMAAVCVPWYVAAERATPGFLDYFVVRENFLRFLVEDYGDRYGHGHTWPYGTIWAMAWVALLPWSPLVVLLLWRARGGGALARLRADPERAFWWAASLAPLVFFTPSRNLVVTYVLPALPPMALLLADALAPRGVQGRETPWSALRDRGSVRALLLGGMLVLTAVAVAAFVVNRRFDFPGISLALLAGGLAACAVALGRASRAAHPLALVTAVALSIPIVDALGRALLSRETAVLPSSRALAAEADALARERGCELAFLGEVPASARFHLATPVATLAGEVDRLRELAAAPGCRLVAIRTKDLPRLGPAAIADLHALHASGRYVLYGNVAAAEAAPHRTE